MLEAAIIDISENIQNTFPRSSRKLQFAVYIHIYTYPFIHIYIHVRTSAGGCALMNRHRSTAIHSSAAGKHDVLHIICLHAFKQIERAAEIVLVVHKRLRRLCACHDG